VTRAAPPPTEYWFEERCHIIEWWNTPADDAVSVARVRIEPGVTTRLHRLKGVTERLVILEGQGLAEVAEAAPREIGAGDVVVVPPGAAQRIHNVGTCDLICIAICTPRFNCDVYEDIDPDPM
jgi:mannose-6-phosphate isomerase-like protein (cupin superfamily)